MLCTLRGKFKKEFGLKKGKVNIDVAAVGDNVEYEPTEKGRGRIYKIEERRNYLSRKAPKIKGAGIKGERLEQIIASNVDKLFIVTSTMTPAFNNRLLDRIIVAAASCNIEPIVVINKSDLMGQSQFTKWVTLYRECGYKVFVTSAKKKIGINSLRKELLNSRSVFWGASGVGKSSLLNVLYPQLDLRVGEISSQTNKGTHTTVTTYLCEVEKGTVVIDTPGIREIEPYGIKKEDLHHYYKEFNKFSVECKFNTCTHLHEPKCKVREAVERKLISEERYKSYCNLLATIEDDMNY